MDAAIAWKECFHHWPPDLERHGVLVTSFGEQIPFEGFSISETMLMVDRRIPDTSGARKIIVAYQHIVALKITDVVKTKVFQAMGFEESVGPSKPGRAHH